jgi:hypothetical protein
MKRITIESPMRLCEYANKVVTSWKLTYLGKGTKEGTYHYTLTHKENNGIKIGVEIRSELEPSYNPLLWYVKIYCKDINNSQKRGYTQLMKLDEFKEVRRVFNTLHDAGRRLIQ